MQGLTYLEDGKEQYARFYAHWDCRLQEVVMDVLHASASVFAEAGVQRRPFISFLTI